MPLSGQQVMEKMSMLPVGALLRQLPAEADGSEPWPLLQVHFVASPQLAVDCVELASFSFRYVAPCVDSTLAYC